MNDFLTKKSLSFAIRIVNLCKFLTEEKKEFVISKQILRSGTSIGANIRESKGAVSKADFVNKLAIAYKEALETQYWLELLFKTEYINKELFDSIFADCDELSKLLFVSQKTAKKH